MALGDMQVAAKGQRTCFPSSFWPQFSTVLKVSRSGKALLGVMSAGAKREDGKQVRWPRRPAHGWGMPLARPMSMHRKVLLLLLLAAISGCGRNPEENAVSQAAPPPAAALAEQGRTLDESLRLLEKELSAAIGAGVEKAGEDHMLRAEAITDRLLEARLPFTWLKGPDYSLEGYVRQIQALADRIIAEIRSGADRGAVTQEAIDLRAKVITLRRGLAMGGGKAPVPLDSLLAGVVADTILPSDAGE